MGLKDLLESRNIPLPSDFDDRLHLVMLGLRNDPQFESELNSFKSKTVGGAYAMPKGVDLPNPNSEDWLGPNVISFLDLVTSPEARGMLKSLFMVIFFVTYLEAIPIVGSILSTALDIMTAGMKAMIKAVQTTLPPAFGLLPIPYASMFGIIMAAIFGAIVWPIVAMVAFTRMDFASAIEAYIRVVPPPLGNILADNFLEVNRMIARIDTKRKKVAYDITTALLTIADVIESVSSQVNEKITQANDKIGDVKDSVSEKIGQFSNTLTNIANAPMPNSNIPSLTPYRSLVAPSAPPPELTPLEMEQRAKNRAENPEVYGALNPDEDHSQRQQAILRQKELTPEPVALPAPVPEPPAPSAPPAPVPEPVPSPEKVSFPPIPPRKVGKGKRLSTNRRRKVNKWTRTLRTKSKRH
jgi:hypothetical protein